MSCLTTVQDELPDQDKTAMSFEKIAEKWQGTSAFDAGSEPARTLSGGFEPLPSGVCAGMKPL